MSVQKIYYGRLKILTCVCHQKTFDGALTKSVVCFTVISMPPIRLLSQIRCSLLPAKVKNSTLQEDIL